MTSSSQITGLISGLDTKSIITSLMSGEAIPQTQLIDKKTDLTKAVTALQSLNAKVASLADAATAASKTTAYQVLKATSSASSVTATADSTASVTSLSFTVDKLAQSQISVSAAVSGSAALTGGASAMTLKVGATLTQIDTSKVSSVADLASAINSAGAGVSATAVTYTDSNGATAYRLQLTGQSTGAVNSFSLYQGTKAAVTAGTATAVTLASTRSAQDAQLTLWPGAGTSQAVTSASNTFANLITGVSVDVTAVETSPVTLGVTRDDSAVGKLGSDLVSQLNLVLGEVSSQTASSTKTNADGTTSVTGGVLSGDSTVRSLSEQISEAGSYDVNDMSPSTIGISVDKDGTFSFDATAFAAALAADPTKVQSMLSSIASRVAAIATTASDKYTGTLTGTISSDNTQVSDLANKIADWTSVLADRQSALESQWANLETSLSALKSQSAWLTSMLGTLSTSSSSSSSSSG